MANHDIVTIGGSAGALQALKPLVKALPTDIEAAIFLVTHVSNIGESRMAEILDGIGPLPAVVARDGRRFDEGRIHVAPPDFHMLIRDGRTHLRRGPRENM